MVLNDEHPKFDLIAELGCCLSRSCPAPLELLVEDLDLERVGQVRALIDGLIGRGFKLEIVSLTGEAGVGVLALEDTWAAMRETGRRYWRELYGGGVKVARGVSAAA